MTVGALACAVALAMALGSSQARAANKAPLTCGAQVTSSITLTSDLGPCPSTADGLDIVASNITVNLNGHTITGTNSTNVTKNDYVGINLINVHGVTVTGPGTIQDFDAGVAINFGDHNTITNLTAQNNVAHVEFSGGVNPSRLDATACNYGDGVVADFSNYNVISKVVTTGNGPFDGIALVDASSYNKVLGSNTYNNNVFNIIQSGPAVGNAGPCGPFSAATAGIGRTNQDIGIRIEGPGATHNVVAGNTVTANMLDGISIHGNVCPNPFGVPPGPPNIHNVVENNTVMNNGFGGNQDGIALLSQGPNGIVCVAYDNTILRNTSSNNARDGIYIGGRGSHGNVIRYNTTDSNGQDGIQLQGNQNSKGPLDPPDFSIIGAIDNTITNNEGHGNAFYDAEDGNGPTSPLPPPSCNNNVWANNSFVTVYPPCIG